METRWFQYFWQVHLQHHLQHEAEILRTRGQMQEITQQMLAQRKIQRVQKPKPQQIRRRVQMQQWLTVATRQRI